MSVELVKGYLSKNILFNYSYHSLFFILEGICKNNFRTYLNKVDYIKKSY